MVIFDVFFGVGGDGVEDWVVDSEEGVDEKCVVGDGVESEFEIVGEVGEDNG